MAKDVRKKDPWALNVLGGMKRKAEETGESIGDWRKEGGFKKSVWSGVRDASRIAAQSTTKGGEIYAFLFVVKGVTEADPRTIPPRRSGGQLAERAWSDQRLQKYRAKLEGAVVEKTKATPPTSPVQDGVLEAAFRRIIREEIGQKDSSRNLGWHLKQTLQLFQIEGKTKSARDQIANKYETELTELFRILSAYSHSPEKREQALALTEALDDNRT